MKNQSTTIKKNKRKALQLQNDVIVRGEKLRNPTSCACGSPGFKLREAETFVFPRSNFEPLNFFYTLNSFRKETPPL